MVSFQRRLNPEKIIQILKEDPILVDLLKADSLKRFYYELLGRGFATVVVSQFTQFFYESGIDVIKELGGVVPENCFSYTTIQNIPDNIKNVIGPFAFLGCPLLFEVIIPDGVTEIGNSAFRNCASLKKVLIPKSVTTIGNYAFSNCPNLKEVILPEKFKREAFEFTGNYIFSNTNVTNFTFTSDSLTEAKEDIQKFVDKFGQDTYDEFKKSSQRLKNNKMSADIYTYIKDPGMDKKKLDTILFNLKQKVSGKDTDLTKIQGKYKYIGEGNGYKIYQPLDAVASMNLGVNTGWCTTGRYGHYGDSNFKPSYEEAAKHFGSYIDDGYEFYYFLDAKTMYGLYAVSYNPSSGDITFWDAEDETVKEIPNIPKIKGIPEAFYSEFEIEDDVLITYLRNEEEVYIPENVKEIGQYAFNNKDNLTIVHIPVSMKVIGKGAFENCESLVDVNIPDGVEKIGAEAFKDCPCIEFIDIPDTVTQIGNKAFYGCESFLDVFIPERFKNNINKIFSNAEDIEFDFI